MAAFQLSCVARGSKFYGSSNVDLHQIEHLFEEETKEISASKRECKPPIAGFFANGEIGPVGIRMCEMATKDAEHLTNQRQNDDNNSNSFLHGFTTVVAMLCDYSGEEIMASQQQLVGESALPDNTNGLVNATNHAWS